MVRGHHDSSQLSAALFGGGESNFPPPRQNSQVQYQNDDRSQVRQVHSNAQNSLTKSRTEWEDSRQSSGVLWGNDNSYQKPTPPTDKPPDPYQYQQQRNVPQQGSNPQYYDPFNQPQQYNKSNPPQFNPQASQQQQMAPFNQQFSSQQQQQQQHQQQQLQLPFPQGMMASPNSLAIPSMNGGGMMLQSPTTPQYFPMQMPLSMPGYGGNYPMYFVMSPQFPPDGTPRMSQSVPNSSDMVLQSISSASSIDSRWPSPPDTQDSFGSTLSLGNKSLTRAKWGEKGVGVGRLWNPEATADSDRDLYSTRNSETLSPPQWAEISQSEHQVLPGAPKSRNGEKTHCRGSAVVLDSQEMAERNRKQRQALETQRIIQQQLDEKKRLQQEEEQREKREAALWEERVKMQQEKERKEMEEEEKKKREKEETEERRQQKLREAIQEAAERAKREKEETRIFNRHKFENKLEVYPESSLENSSSDKHADLIKDPVPEKVLDVAADVNKKHLEEGFSKNETEEESAISLTQLGLPDLVPSAHIGSLNQAQKLALLRALGIAPEFLISSGVLNRSSFMSLLGESVGNDSLLGKEEGGEYVRNVTITPTKFRTSRDCGVQCDGYTTDLSYSEKRSMRRRTSKRQKSVDPKETSRSSPEDKPQWGRHRSERPYRKQSEKDPYQSRKFRRKPVRSISVSDGRESNTDQDSDRQGTPEPRRRRKTWGESLQESLSSDLSRSPSPKSRKGPKINLPRGPPPIKQALTPSLKQDRSHDVSTSASPPNQNRPDTKESRVPNLKTKDPGDVIEKKNLTEKEPETTDNLDSVKKDPEATTNSDERNTFRSTSPPVPALAGTSKFSIPEYPPGFDPDLIIAAPKQLAVKKPKSPPKRLAATPDGNEKMPEVKTDIELQEHPSVPDVLQRTRQMSLPNIAKEKDVDEEVPVVLRSLTALRRASLTSGPRLDSDHPPPKINSITRPVSRASLPKSAGQSTPRRLPPMSAHSSPRETSSPPSATQTNRDRNKQKIVGLNTMDEGQITPVEVTPRLTNQIPLSPETSSLMTLPSPVPFAARNKKDSSDSGVSGDASRPGSASSQIEEVLGASNSSYGYSYLKNSSKELKDYTEPVGDPDKWIILRSLSPVRQRRTT